MESLLNLLGARATLWLNSCANDGTQKMSYNSPRVVAGVSSPKQLMKIGNI